MQRVDLSQYYTRPQIRNQFLQKPQVPLPPTALTISGSVVVNTTTDQYSYVDVTLTDPATPAWSGAPEYVHGYAFKVTFTQLGVSVERDFFVLFGTSYRLQPLPPGANVSITARTIDYLGQLSADSAPVTGTAALDTVAPAAPVIAAGAVVAGGLITLSAPNLETDFNQYELWRIQSASLPLVTDPGWVHVFNFTGTAVTDHAIPFTANNYYYKVVAKDISGNGATSNIAGPVSLVTTGLNPPAVVDFTGATITANADGTVTLHFHANTESSLTGYRIWQRIHGTTTYTLIDTVTAAPQAPGTFFNYIDSQAISGTQYDYTVTALNNVGDESAFPATFLTATALDTTAPAPPSTPTATGRLGSVEVIWNPSTSGGVVGYVITWRLNSSSAFSSAIEVQGNRFTLYGLTATRETLANQLEFNIQAQDSAGNLSTAADLVVDFPSLIGYQPADSTVPNAPVVLSSAINDDGTIDLTWTAPTLADISGYQVEQFDTITQIWTVLATLQDPTPGTKRYKAVGLEPKNFRGRQYRFRVRTIDFSGNISPVNQLENPGFEDGTFNLWTVDGTAPTVVNTPTHNASAHAIRISNNTRLHQDIPVSAGSNYVFTAYVQQDAAAGNAMLHLTWRDATDTVVIFDNPSTSIAVNTNFQRIVFRGTAPVGAALARMYLFGDSVNPAQTFIYDDAQFEQSLIETTYADGKTPLLSAIDTTGPVDYGTIALTATGQLGQILIQWVNPASATTGSFDYINGQFEIWRATNAAFTTAVTNIGQVVANNNGAINSFVDTTPDETIAQTYWYRLKARDRFGNISVYLNGGVAVTTTSLTTNDLNILRKDGLFPSVPVMTSATANNDGTITVVFASANTGGRADLAGYNIYRRRAAEAFQLVGNIRSSVETGSQTFIDQTVDLSTLVAYDYKASAYDSQGEESAQSAAAVSATPIDNRTPAAPTDIVVKGTIGGLSITWIPSTSFGVSKYKITIPSIAGQQVIASTISGTSVVIRMPGGPTVAQLRAPSFYTAITVQAISRSGGALSVSASPSNIIPDSNGDGGLWTVNPNLPFVAGAGANEGGAWRYTGTGAASSFQVNFTPIITVVPGQIYTLSGYIDATNVAAGQAMIWAVYDTSIVTQYAQIAQFSGASGRLSVTFTIPAGVTQVKVINDTINSTVPAGLTVTFSNPQLELSSVATPYQSSFPDMQSYVPIDTIPPDTPAGTPTTSNNQLEALTLSWTASLATDVSFYTIEFNQETGYNTNLEGTWVSYGQVFAPTTSCRIMGLESTVRTGIRYKFRVKAFDNAGNGSAGFSQTAFLSVLDDTTAPATPTGFTAVGTNDNGSASAAIVTCSWTANTERDIFAYELACDKSDGSGFQIFTIPPTSTSSSVRGLMVGVAYRFRVRAVDTSRNRSDFTSNTTVTVAAPPPTNTAPGAPTISLAQSSGSTSSTITVTISCGTGGTENDLNYHSVRRAITNAEGSEIGQVTVLPNAAVGSQVTFSDVRPKASVAATYWYATRTVDNSGLVSPVSNIPSITVAGTGGDPQGDPNCPTMDMYLTPELQVRDAKPGDLVTVLEEDWQLVAYPILRTRMALESCVRLTTENGCVKELSSETSIHLPDGTGDTFAKLMEGKPLVTMVDGSLEISTCHVEDIGAQEVKYIDLGGRVFAAGQDPRHLCFSHNTIILGGK